MTTRSYTPSHTHTFIHTHVHTELGHNKGIYSFDYSKVYKFMASCGLERKILLWDPFTCKSINALVGHSSSVKEVIMDDEKKVLMSLSVVRIECVLRL